MRAFADTSLLGQQGTVDPQFFLWLLALVVVALGGFVVIMALRRRLLRDDTASRDTGFMDELRRLHREGKMGDEEFQAARRALLERATGTPLPTSRTDHAPVAPNRPPSQRQPNSREASPGFDLTGERLPGTDLGGGGGGRESGGDR